MNYTSDEIIAVCISRQVTDGEVVAQGLATPMVAAGFLLAKLTHAPNLDLVSAIGQAVCQEWAPLGIATIEELWIKRGSMTIGFMDAACEYLPHYQPREFFRPGQVDAYGNFNNVFIGGSADQPSLRLPGAGGIPDVTAYSTTAQLYVPRHGRHTFVEEIDIASGLGHGPTRAAGSGADYLVSDLGQFDFEPESGRMRVMSLHAGVPLQRLIAKTGFELILPDQIPETDPPSDHELYLLREVIDPLGVRTLETLGGARRRQKLREILTREMLERDLLEREILERKEFGRETRTLRAGQAA
jgi:acyl CoA:acetate/3-ketoacid CoA transferase beta subunit